MPKYRKTNKFDTVKVFCLLVENDNSLTKTAEKLNTTRQNIANKIYTLEQDLKEKLFDIKGKRYYLTDFGKSFYLNRAKSCVDDFSSFFNEKVEVKKIRPKMQDNIEEIYKRIIKKCKSVVLFKKISVRVRYLLFGIFFISILLTMINQAKEKHRIKSLKIIANAIAGNILQNEKQVEERLMIATLLMEEYLIKNPSEKRDNLLKFIKIANVDRATMIDIGGKKIINTTNLILTDPEVIERLKNYNVLDRVKDRYEFLSNDHNVVIFPMGRDTVTGATHKAILRLSHKLNAILSCAMEVEILRIIKDNLANYPEISYISVSTPSGAIFVDSKESDNIKTNPVEHYNSDAVVFEGEDYTKLQLCFGGLQKENAIRIFDKTANSSGEYFYVLTIFFSK